MEASVTNIREYIEWSQFYWFDAADEKLPRILLIGDSIVGGHAGLLFERLKGRYAVDFWATAKCVTDGDYRCEMDYMLGRFPHQLVIYNNALHGWDIDDDLYLEHLYLTLEYLQKRTPRLAWRSGTPIRDPENLAEFEKERTPRLLKRNAGAAKAAGELGIPVLDWYAWLAGKPEFFHIDGIHYNEAGCAAQADRLAAYVAERLG